MCTGKFLNAVNAEKLLLKVPILLRIYSFIFYEQCLRYIYVYLAFRRRKVLHLLPLNSLIYLQIIFNPNLNCDMCCINVPE